MPPRASRVTRKAFSVHLHPVYKKLLLICVVAGPLLWLTFTLDGQRRTDLLLLWIAGDPGFSVAVEKLSPTLDEETLRSQFSDLQFHCEDRESSFGNRSCSAVIANFNQIPARYVSLFFVAGHLSAMKVAYRRPYQEPLVRGLYRTLGEPLPSARSTEESSDATGGITWKTGDGLVVVPSGRVDLRDEPALFWLSPQAAQGQFSQSLGP